MLKNSEETKKYNSEDLIEIRPAGRVILTLGRDLIQDSVSAIIELVKNAYDADAQLVSICFTKIEGSDYIIVEDTGYGMSRDVVINQWMVPATPNKLKNKLSPKGRKVQGRKGIGRYAAAILGNTLELETTDQSGMKTTAKIDWSELEEVKYLADICIPVVTVKTKSTPGTILKIKLSKEQRLDWTNENISHLKNELKKLVSPFHEKDDDDLFDISLIIDGKDEVIKPFPLLEAFHYRIYGTIQKDGTSDLKYINHRISGEKPEEIIDLKHKFDSTQCGNISLDIRVYDRETSALDEISKSLHQKPADPILKKSEVRMLLNEFKGIGVYRDAFRIRPLGDSDYDWLKLNEKRVQDPSKKIGSNQVIGYVQIQSEEDSGLIEKSARDGLITNKHFQGLIEATSMAISFLESYRFEFRKKIGLSRTKTKLEEALNKFKDSASLIKNVEKALEGSGIKKEGLNKIKDIIKKDTDEKAKIFNDIQETVAIYQGQATLGKIMAVVLHEGRTPLNIMKERLPRIQAAVEKIEKEPTKISFEELLKKAQSIPNAAGTFISLFNRLDPLSMTKRSDKKNLFLKKEISEVVSIFENLLKEKKISVKIEGDDKFEFLAWKQDIYAIFSNLIDNSIYWIEHSGKKNKEINISINTENSVLTSIEYKDTGTGIPDQFLRSGIIFEPEFSTKIINGRMGTGLGLAIAGEAASRHDLELKAQHSENGAYFILEPKENDYENISS